MGWSCRRYRTHLALLVGGDLSERESAAIEVHVSDCIPCQKHLASLRSSREAMLSMQDVPAELDAPPSLWPTLRVRLNHGESVPPRRRSWLPVGAMAAASVAIGTVLWNRSLDFGPTRSVRELTTGPLQVSGGQPVNVLDVTDRGTPGLLDPPDLREHALEGRFNYHLESARPVGLSPQDF